MYEHRVLAFRNFVDSLGAQEDVPDGANWSKAPRTPFRARWGIGDSR